MKRILKSFLCLTLGVMAFSSCTNNDVYDPNYAKEQYDNAFKTNVLGGSNIDSQQNWNSSVMSTLNVNIQLDLLESYTLRLFTANPLYDSQATLLAQTTGKTGETVSMKFAKPMASTTLYVEAINSKNRYNVQTVDMTGTEATVALGASATSRTNISGTSTDPATYQKEESAFISPSVLEGNGYYDVTTMAASDLSQLDVTYWDAAINGNKTKYGDGKHYVVPAEKTVKANLGYSKQKDADCIILVKGTWEVPNDIQFSNSQLIVVAEGGKIIFDGNAEFNSLARMVNKGQIVSSSGDISIQNWSGNTDFYNAGTLSLTNGGLIIAGNYSQIYNKGNLTVKYLSGQGQSTVVNFGTLIAESTAKNNYTTEGQSTAVSNLNLVNACNATVKAAGFYQLILCNSSRLNCSTGLYTGGGNGGNVYMGDHAVIKAGNWIDNGGKFYGPVESANAAIFQFTGTICEKNVGSFSTTGYLYYDGNLNDSNDASGESSHYQLTVLRTGVWNNSTVISNYIKNTCSESTTTISIPKGDCTGDGYNPKDDPVDPPVITPTTYYYAFEDMGSIGDYDFNDVVLSVEYPVLNGTQKDAVIKLCAAGGTLPVSVKYNSETICEEVHTAFGVSTTTMVNTGATAKDAVTIKTLSNVGDSFDASSLALSIVVSNNKTSTEVKANAQSGEVPQMIRVPAPWKWPKETVNISVAYGTENHSFGTWGANYGSNTDWYEYPVASRTME